MVKITRATEKHIPQLIPLFDAYRIFYKQKSDKVGAQSFLKERFENHQSIVFLAYIENNPVGFTQLYTTFSSVSLQPYFILNDLYVHPSERNKGIGKALLNRAKLACKEINYKGIALETATDNQAQKLYEKLDWKKDSNGIHYFWSAN